MADSPTETEKEEVNAGEGAQFSDSEPCSTANLSSDANSDTSESGSESEEDFEPLFNYSRITRLPSTFFHKDAVSAVLIHPMVYAFATHSGLIHLARPDMTPIRTLRNHRASVVDIDTDGTYVATASIDGTVVTLSIQDEQDVTPASFNRPIHAVALDPNYKTTKTYLSGGTAGAVMKSEKGWLRGRKDTTLFECTSTILAIKWVGDLAFWCTEDGITVYDMTTSTALHQIARLPNSPRANLYRPEIRPSPTDSRVLIGWGSALWILDTSKPEIVVSSSNVEWLISGLAFFNDSIILLCSRVGEEPELRTIDFTGSETYADELSLVGYDRLGPNDYHLAGEGPFYLVSAKDGVVAKERDARDHVDWLMNRGKFFEAYHSSRQVCDSNTRKMIGLKAVGMLVEAKRWHEAADLLADILGPKNPDEWRVWADKFILGGQYFEIADILPKNLPGLAKVRTDILQYAIEKSPNKLLEYVSSWDALYYDAQSVVNDLDPEDDPVLVEARALLHERLGEPLSAVRDYLEINSSAAFTITAQSHLWSDALSLLPQILKAGQEPDIQDRLAVLVANHLQVSPDKVVQQLGSGTDDELLFKYLQRLAIEDEELIRGFGDLLVKLYGDFDRSQLMTFLTRNDSYDLNKAIQVCERHEYTEELVYLLGRVGQTQRALELLLTEMDAVEQAVQFAADHEEKDLWDALIRHSTSKPELVIRLLRCPQVSPVQVLLKVPETLKIVGLRDTLSDIFDTQGSIVDLNNGALAIFRSESKSLLTRLQKSRTAGLHVEMESPNAPPVDRAVLIQDQTILEVSDIEGGQPFGRVSTFSDKIRHFAYLLTFLRASDPVEH